MTSDVNVECLDSSPIPACRDGRRHQRYTQEFRELAVSLQAQSGLDAAAFCRREGILPKTFYRWRQGMTGDASTMVLAPVTVRQDRARDATATLSRLSGTPPAPGTGSPSHPKASSPVALELHLKNGRSLQARLPADVRCLLAMFRALEALP